MAQMGPPPSSLTSSEGRSRLYRSPASRVEPPFAAPCMEAQLTARRPPMARLRLTVLLPMEHIRRLIMLAPPAGITPIRLATGTRAPLQTASGLS